MYEFNRKRRGRNASTRIMQTKTVFIVLHRLLRNVCFKRLTYLCTRVYENNTRSWEIRRRTGMAKTAFYEREKQILQSKKMNTTLGKRIPKTHAWSTALYIYIYTQCGHADIEQKWRRIDQIIWDTVQKVNWVDIVTNEQVPQQVNEKNINHTHYRIE